MKTLVAWGGIEPPTRGFSIRAFFCVGSLMRVDRLEVNQRFTGFASDAAETLR